MKKYDEVFVERDYNVIKLNHTSLHKMKLHAMKAYPEECCGVLMGREIQEAKMVCDILEIPNTREDRRDRRYVVSPEAYRRAEQEAKEGGVEILGLYHSHPDHPASPSQFDLDYALPNWSYVIVSVDQGQPEFVRSWVMKEDRSRFDEEVIEVLDGEFKHHCA